MGALAVLSAGCAHNHDITQARSPCLAEPGGWCPFIRDAATKSWEYAQLSQNTYADDEDFEHLPTGLIERFNSGNDKLGYAYAIYDRMDGDILRERIIAFRGTEASIQDWIVGNLRRGHNKRGEMTYRAVRDGLDRGGWPDVPVTVTGHSLGGAIAMHISLRHDGAASFVFNESPQYIVPEMRAENPRMAVNERGGALENIRRKQDPFLLDSFVVNCRPDGDPFGDHSIRQLAECLTWIAAFSSATAQKSVVDNDLRPPLAELGLPGGVRPAVQSGAQVKTPD